MVNYNGTGFDNAATDVAFDDGSEPDATADLHGTDFQVTIPAGTPTGTYQILLIGVGHTANARTSKSVTLNVGVLGAANGPCKKTFGFTEI